MSGGTTPPYDPLAGTPGAASPPSTPPPAYPQYPAYPAYPPETTADDEFKVHWPRSWTARVGIVLLGGLTAWLFLRVQIEQAGALLGILLTMLGFGQQSRKAIVTVSQSAATARAMAARTAAVTQQVARDVKITKEVVRDIANDPTKPGTPGAMERREAQTPPFANL